MKKTKFKIKLEDIKKVAHYSRVSKAEQIKGYSLETQNDSMNDDDKSKGHECVHDYQDGGISASDDKRPQFRQMIVDALAGKFEAIKVYKFDRIFRNIEDTMFYKSQLRAKGIRVISVKEPMDDSPASFMSENMIHVNNEFYLLNLAQLIKEGKYKGAEKGNYQGGTLKFGYTLDKTGDKPQIIVDKKEADTVVSIFEKYSEGLSLGQLAKLLNSKGMPCKNNGRWRKQNLSKILHNRIYIGEGKYGEVVMPYPRIVTDDLFYKVQTRPANKKSGHPAKSGRIYLLSHLGRCGECGGALLHETQRQYRYIYCYRQSEYPDEHQCFKPKRRKVDWLEQEIWDQITGILSKYEDDTYDLLLQKYDSSKPDRENQIRIVRANIKKCKQERKTVLRQVRKDNITQADADVEFTIINKEETEWQLELNGMLATNDAGEAELEQFMEQFQALRRHFFVGFWDVTPERQKEIINLLVKEFLLYKDGRMELRFKLPVNEKQVAEKIRELSVDALVR